MFSRRDLKVLVRSRSLRFMRDWDPARFVPGARSSFEWRGRIVHYRPGSSDLEVIYKILLKEGKKAEYYVPEGSHPQVIWDIGANIGAASLYFASRFPRAEIHCFEPIPENCELLERNISGNPQIHAHRCGLGPREGTMSIHASDISRNFGGFSFHYDGAAAVPMHEVRVRTPREVIADSTALAPDLIKIDVEGAEYDILTAFDPEILARVNWITGELHSKRSFALLEFLSEWFDIGMKKTLGKPLFNFQAKNKLARKPASGD